MVIDTVKENLCINKRISTKKEIFQVEGDMIVPDSKPDILNTICTSGVVCIYKKEIMTDKIRIDGNINTYIMYLADSSEDKVRGINTDLDFSEFIQVPNCQEGMTCKLEVNLKSIESKIINGRKINIKATVEAKVSVFSNEEVEIINDLTNAEEIKMLKEDLKVNSLVGTGETKIYAKDNIAINNIDNLAEILKSNICICDKDVKVSYNKILVKAEAEVNIMYLTEDNRINCVNAKIPVVGFIDIQNVNDDSICDVNYEIKNILLKPNPSEEHSVYVEIEVGVVATVYEEKQINLIQDLYSPCENLDCNKKKITTITDKKSSQEIKQIREKLTLEGMENKSIIDVDVIPIIENENKLNSRIIYEGELQLMFVVSDNEMQIDTKSAKIPFEYAVENLDNGEEMNTDMEMEILNKDFILQDGGIVSSNIDIKMNMNSYRNTDLNIMDEIQTNGEREAQDYSIVMYIVKKDDTLWKIAKTFGSTIEDIVRTNGIEDENKIDVGQKLFIPRYVRKTNKQNPVVVNYA